MSDDERIIEASIETLRIGDGHLVALQKVEYPDKPTLEARVWRGQVLEYFGDPVHRDDRVLAEDRSFYVAAAKALDAHGNSGEDAAES
jgi:hypothetical protein